MTLPDLQNGDKLDKDPGTRASFVPCPHPYTSPCSNGDASAATAELLRSCPSIKAPLLPHMNISKSQEREAEVRQLLVRDSGSDMAVTHPQSRKTFFPNFLVDMLPNYSYLCQGR